MEETHLSSNKAFLPLSIEDNQQYACGKSTVKLYKVYWAFYTIKKNV